MADAITEKYEEMVLEIESAPDVFARPCGMKGVTVNRSAELDSDEIPDCDDESKPFSVEKEVRSLTVTVSGSGVWARQSHGMFVEWFYSGTPKKIRLGHLNAAVGDTEYETGTAFLKSLSNQRTKGKKVTAEIELEFNGTPTRTAKA